MGWGGLAGKAENQEKETGAGETERPRIVIIGAGISGLAAAYRLTRPEFCGDLDPEVLLLERSSRAGGVISTYELEDYTLELGPDMFQTAKPEAIDLCKEIGLGDHIVSTNEGNRRTFIAYGGQLHALPEGFNMLAPSQLGPFFSSSLLSFGGKLRMAADLLIPKRTDGGDESLAQFVRRRFGQEALDRIAQPMVGGIYTADPEVLSLQATLPRFLEMEQKHSSIIRALMQDKKNGNGASNGASDAGCRYSTFASLSRGLGMMVERLVGSVPPDTLHFQCPIIAVEKGTRGKQFDVVVANGTVVPADAVILSTPSFASAEMIHQLDAEASNDLKRIQYASSAVMNLIYNRADIPHPLDGFGFVIPQVEKRTIMACSFASVKFPGRCPAEKAVLRVFVGGALQQDVFELTDEQIECLMWEDLHTYLGLKSVPLLSLITRYQRAMPQYHLGHIDLVKGIREKLSRYPGIALAGGAYDGVGIPDCIRSGNEAAKAIVEGLRAIATANGTASGGSPEPEKSAGAPARDPNRAVTRTTGSYRIIPPPPQIPETIMYANSDVFKSADGKAEEKNSEQNLEASEEASAALANEKNTEATEEKAVESGEKNSQTANEKDSESTNGSRELESNGIEQADVTSPADEVSGATSSGKHNDGI